MHNLTSQKTVSKNIRLHARHRCQLWALCEHAKCVEVGCMHEQHILPLFCCVKKGRKICRGNKKGSWLRWGGGSWTGENVKKKGTQEEGEKGRR